MGIIAAIVVFCILVLSHELGHFAAAKACGVYVEDFSLGMGPKLFSWQGKETSYTLRLFPIGGLCLMRGEDEESCDPRAFCQKKVWQRMLIVAAGPVMNFLCAILIFVIVFMMIGTASTTSEIGVVLPDSPAESAGLLAEDVIIAIDGAPIGSWQEMSAAILAAEGETMAVTVDRDGTEVALSVTPEFNEENGYWMIGVQTARARQNLFTAIGLGAKQSVLFVQNILSSIVGMIVGTVEVEVGGPVAIMDTIGQAARYGMESLLLITGYLCVNLGLLNLFPLPALDGSRLVFLAVEGVRGKPFDREKEGMIHFVGLVLLMGLMVFITYQDILRLING